MAIWLKIYIDLPQHPKTQKLRAILGVDLPTALGYLQLLWGWAARFAEDGFLDKFDPQVIGLAIARDLETGKKIVPAMIESGFLDQNPLRVHDWLEVHSVFLLKKYSNAGDSLKLGTIKKRWSKIENGKRPHKNAETPKAKKDSAQKPKAKEQAPRPKSPQQLLIEHFAKNRGVDLSNLAAQDRFFKQHCTAATELLALSGEKLDMACQAVEDIARYLDELVQKKTIEEWSNLAAINNHFLKWKAIYDSRTRTHAA